MLNMSHTKIKWLQFIYSHRTGDVFSSFDESNQIPFILATQMYRIHSFGIEMLLN